MNEAPTSLDLQDIPEINDLIPQSYGSWWLWLLLLLFICVVVIAIRWHQNRQMRHYNPRQMAFEEAMKALDEAKMETRVIAMATSLSFILRHYLSVAFADTSLFETHEEFLSRHQALQHLPESLRRALTDFFHTLCRYKYAPITGSIDLSLLVPQATSLLQQIHALPSPEDTAP